MTEIIEKLSDVIPSGDKHEEDKKKEDLNVKDMRDDPRNEDQKVDDKDDSKDPKNAPTWNDMSPDTEFNDPNKEGK
ncbi:hypothetical protein [Lentilactobacillus kosonis]|uniref:hypothetical protein n=1 Tax=Lentilactobacillus kosonis TaxID=2810561 RepID=UPI000F61C925|nr:hypothetical protein [Lentilactobacillus kosonis]